jgi:cytoskeletal protein CcmA (bactofilin family)
MANEKVSILLSDVSINGNMVETEKVIVDAKIRGDISAEEVVTHRDSNIKGNIKAKNITIGGIVKGNLNSDKIKLTKTANVDGVLNQKTLSIEDGANLKIKSETYK